MSRLSSNLTIILKWFIPLLYSVFFGSYLLASFFVSEHDSPLMASWQFKLIFASVFLLFLLIFRFTVIKLKRVDASGEVLAVSNYVKTYQYKWNDVDYIKTKNYGLFRTMRIYFKSKTSFGNYISFLPSETLVEEFVRENPHLGQLISEEE